MKTTAIALALLLCLTACSPKFVMPTNTFVSFVKFDNDIDRRIDSVLTVDKQVAQWRTVWHNSNQGPVGQSFFVYQKADTLVTLNVQMLHTDANRQAFSIKKEIVKVVKTTKQ